LQFRGTQPANRIVITAGKFSVVDIFDTNEYAGPNAWWGGCGDAVALQADAASIR
jgi:hypothetical protein